MGNSPALPAPVPAHDIITDELNEVDNLIKLTIRTTSDDPELYKRTATETINKLIGIIKKYDITETQTYISQLEGKLTALSEYEKNANTAEKFNGNSNGMGQYVNNGNNATNAGTLKRLKRLTDELLEEVFIKIAPKIEAISQEEYGRRKMGGGSRKSKKSHKKYHK